MRLACTLLAVLAMVAGCTGSGDDVPNTTITVQEADARVERHIREVAAALPGARLEPLSEPLKVPCGGIVGGPDNGMVYASRSYQFRGIAADQIDAAIDTAIGYWTANGYQVRTDARTQGYIQADAPDGTWLPLQNATEGYLTIAAYSICVWPDGLRPAP